ncbi:MAG: CDP-glycerol glycerophosphotransferase family protein [Trichloromonas sp.]|jgi:CDP-glycerol glycerophosphotransferase (TagB/SpsB family)|nr:CDP-glycerol glycerophosphotransferase family protein [Trichloromonas sp.]
MAIKKNKKIYSGDVLLISRVLVFFANILLTGLRIFPVKKGKVVYWARGLSLYGNASAICNIWANYPNTSHVYLINRSKTNFLPVGNNNVSYLPLRSLRAIYHISNCNFLIKEADMVSPPLYIRKETKVIQLWHAAGAFKKFGLDINNRTRTLKRFRKNDSKRWDFLLCSSINVKDIYSNAFSLKNRNLIYVDGLPRNDRLFYAINKSKHLKIKYGFELSKKIILFAPTFRDDHSGGNLVSELISVLNDYFSKDYTICVRLHPSCLSAVNIPENVIDASFMHPLEDLLSFVDFLITDYSSIIFDFSLLSRPMLFYAPDLDKYLIERDFYFGYENFVPGPVCTNLLSVIENIKSYDFEIWKDKINNFKKKYNPIFDGNCSKRIIEKINSI